MSKPTILPRSIRGKLLGSLLLALVVSAFVTTALVGSLQGRKLTATSSQISSTLKRTGEDLQTALVQVNAEVGEALARQVAEGGDALADLLAVVGADPILGRDYAALLGLVKAASQNPGVAYAVYFNAKGRAVTRYFDKTKPALDGLLREENGKKRKPGAVIEASSAREYLRLVERPVVSDGETWAASSCAWTRPRPGPGRPGSRSTSRWWSGSRRKSRPSWCRRWRRRSPN